MASYKDMFINIDDFNEEKMIYVKPILFYKISKNIGIYYKQEIPKANETSANSKKSKIKKYKKQKIIIQSPKMMAPFAVKEYNNNGRKNYQLCLSFNTLTNLYNEEEIKKFFILIQKIDNINEETVLDHKTNWGLPKKMKYKKTLQQTSEDFPHNMYINLPYDEKVGFLFNVYDEQANKSGIEIIDKRSIVSVVLELTDLRFGDTEYRSTWTALQIRKFKPYSPIQDFFMSGCFICDNDDPEDTAYLNIIEKYQKRLAMSKNLSLMPQMHYQQNFNQQNFNRNAYSFQHSSPPPPPPPFSSTTSGLAPNLNKQFAQAEAMTLFKPPTKIELENAINALKKSKTINKSVPIGRILSDSNDNKQILKNDNKDNNKDKIKTSDKDTSKQKKSNKTSNTNVSEEKTSNKKKYQTKIRVIYRTKK